MLGGKAAEVGNGREGKHVGDVLQRQGRIAQKARHFQRRVTVNPMDGRRTAIQFDGLGQVLGGHTEGISIIRDLAMREPALA